MILPHEQAWCMGSDYSYCFIASEQKCRKRLGHGVKNTEKTVAHVQEFSSPRLKKDIPF